MVVGGAAAFRADAKVRPGVPAPTLTPTLTLTRDLHAPAWLSTRKGSLPTPTLTPHPH